MKKMIVILVILAAGYFGIPAMGNSFIHSLNVAIDSELSDTHDFTVSGSTTEYDVKTGYSLIYEGHKLVSDYVDVGFGLEFMLPHELDVSGSEAEFNFAPVYFSCVMHGYRYRDYVPYLSLQFGYSLLYDGNDDYKSTFDLTGGLYYGAGIGLTFSQVTRLEFRWSRYEGLYDTGMIEADVSNDEFSLVLGYLF